MCDKVFKTAVTRIPQLPEGIQKTSVTGEILVYHTKYIGIYDERGYFPSGDSARVPRMKRERERERGELIVNMKFLPPSFE